MTAQQKRIAVNAFVAALKGDAAGMRRRLVVKSRNWPVSKVKNVIVADGAKTSEP